MEKEFLQKYAELCLEYGFEIKGCGECGSAWLQELGEQQKKNKTLSYNSFSYDYSEISFSDDSDMNDPGRIKLSTSQKEG